MTGSYSQPTRLHLGHATVDPINLAQAVDRIAAAAKQAKHPFVVVTPNIQHIVLLETDHAFRASYQRADLVLPDGWPVAYVLRRHSGQQVERVTGADLLPALLERSAHDGLTVGMIGGRPGAVELAASRARAQFPGIDIRFCDGGSYSDLADESDVSHLLNTIGDGVDLLVLGLGTPKQEVLIARTLAQHPTNVGAVLCSGAAIDFFAQVVQRAPVSWQRLGMEWAYRVLHEPRRLAGRYVKAAPAFAAIVIRDRGRGHST